MHHSFRKLTAALAVALLATLSGCFEGDPRVVDTFFFDFETDAELDYIAWDCGELFSRSTDFATSGSHSLRLDLRSGDNLGLRIYLFDPDWSAYETMRFDVHNPQTETVMLRLEMADHRKAKAPERFVRLLALAPGSQQITLPLDSLRARGSGRPFNRRTIQSVKLTVPHLPEPLTLYFDHFHLR